jgi:16S rRNA (guanine527-N7)-methyltransferase
MLTAKGKVAWRISEIATHVGANLTDESQNALAVWLDTLAVWNARMDLTAAKTNDDAAELMLTDALELSKHVPHKASVVDVGVGAGAPGFALALARPDLRVTLVESLGKRVSFLRTVIGMIGRVDVTLVSAKGETLVPAEFDVAISRATLEPAAWLDLGLSLVRPLGSVWVLVASEDAVPPATKVIDDRAHGRTWTRSLVSERFAYTLPFTHKSRLAVRFDKNA